MLRLWGMRFGLIVILAGCVLTGCGGKHPIPAGRLEQPAGEFSFVTPNGWYRTKLAGIDFIIVSADPDHGARPNIFVDVVEVADLNGAAKNLIQSLSDNYSTYEITDRTDFMTDSGLQGLKITAGRKNRDALSLTLYHYLFQDGARVIGITCICSARVKKRYEAIFDSAMKSLRSERHTP